MILYFSGTGNTEHAARLISEITGDELININRLIKDGIAGDFISEAPYVLVCPTYAWRIPRIVEDFLRTAYFSGSHEIYVVLTCGSGTAGAQTYARRLCEEIGMTLKGFRTVIMPENYIALFNVPDENEAEQINNQADAVIEAAAVKIKAREPLEEKVSPMGFVMSKIVNAIFFRFIVKDKGFHLEKDCIGCGKCVELCPLNNISLVGEKPVWNGNCTHCMACICACPQKCIEYKNSTQKKRRYWYGR